MQGATPAAELKLVRTKTSFMKNTWKEFWSTYRFDGRISEDLLFEQVGRTSNGKPLPGEEFELCVDFMGRSLQLSPTDLLFEYCCGNGLFTYELGASVRKIVAVDFSDHLIHAARQFRQRDNISYFVGNALEPLSTWLAQDKPAKFLMANALAYFDPEEFGQLLQSLCTTVAPGSFLFLLTGIPDADRKWNFYDTPERRERHIKSDSITNDGMGRWWTRDELRVAAEAHGLSAHIIPEPGAMSHYRMAVLLS
jgi:SAM-dependent methyltransferase